MIALYRLFKFLIMYGPSLGRVVAEIEGLLKAYQHRDVASANVQELRFGNALDHYRLHGDKEPLEELRDELLQVV